MRGVFFPLHQPPAMPPAFLTSRASSRLVWAAFGLGLVLSSVMVVRGQLGGDQLNLLARGWLLAAHGEWISYGNPMSTGGNTPGGITSLLVGLPLFFWSDYRAPSLLVLLTHLIAWFVLDGALKRVLSPRERLLFAVFYWLNPLRLYFSGFLWNPNYLFLFGALHLWSCWAQRERPRFGPSFLLAGGLVLAFQIHPSAVLLGAASALLWLRGYVKPHWLGGIAGAALAAAPLVPWVLELDEHPAVATEVEKGFPFRGLVLVYPLVRGLSYWLRHPSLFLPDKVTRFDFSGSLGENIWFGPAATAVAKWLLPLSLLVPLAANVWLIHRHRRRLFAPLPEGSPDRRWLQGYVFWCLVAAIAVYGLAPTTPMYWQGVVLFHAAVLPLVLWGGVLWRSRRRVVVGRGVAVWAALGILLAAAVAWGAPQYRCGGRHELRFPLDSHSPMFDDLNITPTCPWPLDRPDTWWPDVLPRADRPVAAQYSAKASSG